jgi:predicted ATPase/DNA-binding CsgD family transcriptional regulator
MTPPSRAGEARAWVGAEDRPEGPSLQLTSFVGRERELREIEGLLEGCRMVTLAGPGGCGKTRLALEARDRVAGTFGEGARWTWLAPVSDPNLVPEAVARAVGLHETPGLSPAETVAEGVGVRELLLVLDNCEHVVGACADLADLLLKSCPGLKILCTSREALDVAGETVWPVPPLSRPTAGSEEGPEALSRYEAVGLFVERAGTAAPGFDLTAENAAAVAGICLRLDGLPLAIELAAARVRMLSPVQISARLDDALGLLTGGSRTAPSRHRTLRGTLDWSYGLLPDEERVLFRRLSVFVGGFALGAAEKVCAGDGLAGDDVLDLLSRLVDKSLVAVGHRGNEARYRLLATVRQYAAEKLTASGEEEWTRRRHAAFFLGLARDAEAALRGPGQERWLDRLEAELGNLRDAVRRSVESGRSEENEAGLRLAGALWRFCYLRGYYGQGRAWLETALASGASAPPEARAEALIGAGVLALLQCEYGQAEERLREALVLCRELGDGRGEASALQMLGSVARERGHYGRAEAHHEESLELWRGLGDEHEAARSLNYLGFVAWLQERHGQARDLCGPSLATFRRLGDAEGVTWALINLGSAALYGGEPGRAEALLEEGLSTASHAGYREGVAWSLGQLGTVARRYGDQGGAEELLRESLKAHRELGDRWRMASAIENLAGTAQARGLPERAARLFGAADTLRRRLSAPIPPAERADRDEGLRAARAGLDEGRFEKALAAGRAMGLEEATALAMQETPDPGPAAQMSHGLSAREVEVLGLVAEGLTNAEVAERLSLSPRTVGHHLRTIYRKLRVPSRTAAAKAALERGLI